MASSEEGNSISDLPPLEIFCSYAQDQRDEALLRELEQQLSPLQREGHLVLWHQGQIGAGENRKDVLKDWQTRASVILLLVSPAFLASDVCTQETYQAMQRQKAREVHVIPVILRPCNWSKTPFARLQCLPRNRKAVSTWKNRDQAWQEVAEGLREMFDKEPQPADVSYSSRPTYWNVPFPRNPFFTGHDDLLEQLHTQLRSTRTAALGQTQAISGLGGIGKTQLAIEYAYRYRQEYRAVLWAHAESLEALTSSYVSIATLLQLPMRDTKEQEVIIQAVKTWLQVHRDWLFLLDNADEPDLLPPFIPLAPGGHLLVTTRTADLSSFGLGFGHSLVVHTLDPELGAQLLLHRAGLLPVDASLDQATPRDRLLAQHLCQELGGLPLALDQAGAYLAATQTDLSTYQQWYQQHRARLLADRRGREHPASVSTTLSLSFQRVTEKNPAAADVLRLCAYLSPDMIPESIFMQSPSSLSPQIAHVATDALWFSQAVDVLRAYSLVKRDAQMQTLTVHRLVQAVLQDEMQEVEQSLWAKRALLAINAAFPHTEHVTWSQCERLLPQALQVIEGIERYHLIHLEAGRLLDETASYLQDRARYAEAEPLYQQALVIHEQLLGPEHPDAATSLNGLANLYYQQGKEAEAEPLYQRALAIREQQLGPEHPDVATSLNNLANLYHRQGKDLEAEQLYQRALRIWKQQGEPEHPNVAYPLTGLASLYRKQGKYTKAEPLYQRALIICEQQLGPEHPLVASPLNNLAGLYRIQGKDAEAELLYQRALHILEQQLGLEHPDVAYPLAGLAGLYHAQGKDAEAELLYQRALRILGQQ